MIVAGVAVAAAVAGNVGTAFAARENCRRIDQLYTRVRENAVRTHNELPKTAALLGIVITEQVRMESETRRDRTLEEYAPINCSIWIWHR